MSLDRNKHLDTHNLKISAYLYLFGFKLAVVGLILLVVALGLYLINIYPQFLQLFMLFSLATLGFGTILVIVFTFKMNDYLERLGNKG